MNINDATSKEMQMRLGYKPLSRTWAKIEIFLGLTAAWLGVFLGCSLFSENPIKLGGMP